MKLKNKRTGEIRPAEAREDGIYLYDETTDQWYKYELDLLAKWWEYYEKPEKPEEHWAIDQFGEPINVSGLSSLQLEKLHQLGNDFSSENATIEVLEKLKAWRRLEDKGFRFDGYDVAHKSNGNLAGQIFYDAGNYSIEDIENEMDLLFGGEDA